MKISRARQQHKILGVDAFDSTNSAQIIVTGPGLYAVMGGADVTEVHIFTQQKPNLFYPCILYTPAVSRYRGGGYITP